jgi:hypothetical protein
VNLKIQNTQQFANSQKEGAEFGAIYGTRVSAMTFI